MHIAHRQILTACALMVFGGLCYGGLEILYRGYTHISMIIAGGVCFTFLVALSARKQNPLMLGLVGSVFVTAVEFLAGCVVNLWLGLEVWDYSHEAMHLLGQICPRFFFMWWGLCFAVIGCCKGVRRVGRKALPPPAFPVAVPKQGHPKAS